MNLHGRGICRRNYRYALVESGLAHNLTNKPSCGINLLLQSLL